MSFDISYGSPYLRHHGIKGQRWGVQNGPPYPLDKKTVREVRAQQNRASKIARKGIRDQVYRDPHTIPAGTLIYRTTTNKDESPSDNMYVSYIDADRHTYRGGWIRQTQLANKAYEKTYVLKKDLKVPGRDEVVKLVEDIAHSNPDLYQKTAEHWVNGFFNGRTALFRLMTLLPFAEAGDTVDDATKKFVDNIAENLKNKETGDLYFDCMQTFGTNTEFKDKVIDELKNRGYNAMTDEASVGGHGKFRREGIDPLIIFDGKNSLDIQKTKEISRFSEQQSLKKNTKFRNAANSSVALARNEGTWSAFDIYSDELYHHGIKGQRWGVKRFQNADRTWTEAGKIRYGRKGNGRDGAGYFGEKSGRAVSGGSYFSAKDQRTLDLNTKTHQLNTKAPLIQYGINIVSDILVPNPLYIAMDVSRGARVVTGMIKSNKYSKERERSDIDETTGFHLKNKQLPEKDDIKRVNPDVNDFNSNSKSNCVLCTVATEMRRRGYDVTANKSGTGYYDEEIKRFFPEYKIKTYGRNDIGKEKGAIKATFGLNNKFASDIIDRIEKEQPEGSRGNISVMWGYDLSAGRSIKAAIRGGHSMFYEIKNGKLVISDGQIGKIYKDPQKILKKCSAIQIGRLDNLDFDIEGIKEACR